MYFWMACVAARAELRVETFLSDKLLSLVREHQVVVHIIGGAYAGPSGDINDLEDVFLAEAVEDHHIVDTVQEFRRRSVSAHSG